MTKPSVHQTETGITQTCPCNIQQFLKTVKMIIFDIFLIFAQNIDCGYTSEPPLTSTHNLCFRAKIRKNVYPCKPQFYFIKVEWKGVFTTQTCFRDGQRWFYSI